MADASFDAAVPGLSLIREARTPRSPGERRLLLLSPGFPPSPEVGGLRWQKMLRTLAEAGWAADVLTVLPANEQHADPRRLEDLPGSTRVFALPAACMQDARVRHLLAAAIRVRRLLVSAVRRRAPVVAGSPAASVPPPAAAATPATRTSDRMESGWRASLLLAVHRRNQHVASRALARAAHHLAREGPAVLVSSGPPHSAHLAALAVARRTGLPWVMDCRDPWTFDEFLEPFDPAAFARAERPSESACVETATVVVVNSAPVQRRLAELYPGRAERIVTIPNGADAERLPAWTHEGPMRIVYAGALFRGRDPRLFMGGVAAAIARGGVPPHEIVLQFVTGTPEYEGRPLAELARELGVEAQVQVHPFMPRHRLLEWLAGTAVNVLVQVPSTYQVPAKLFEYMQMPAWLVAVTNAPNALSDMLAGSTGIVVAPDAEQLGTVFGDLYRRRAAGERPTPVNDGRYDRARRAQEMLAVLERVARR